MLFFPTPYPDELLFSLCSRYYVRSGNISYKGTLDDLYSNRSLTASISLPSGISSLIKNMPPFSKMNEEQVIHQHTLFLFNSAFLPFERAKTIHTEMCSNDGKGVYVRSGLNASAVTQNEFLRYCKDCVQEDRELFGELYWHRNHQISGIHCCLKHYTPLYDSDIKVVGSNKHRFAIPTLENCSAKKSVLDGVAEKTRLEYIMHCKKLKKSILQILEQPYVHHPLEWFDQKYRNKLANMGLAYYTGRVKQKDWREYFQTIYSEEVLHLFHSPLRGNQDWLSQIVQKNRKSFHPVRHLLVILALELTIEEIFKKSLPQPFGQPNYPCQNIVCEYYNVPIIENVSITLCEKTKIPIGTFTCPKCEFSYTRRGPDQNEADKFRRTRVKSYGSLWERKLQEFSKSGIGLRELSRRMGADPNTIRRFLNSEEETGLEIENTENFVTQDQQSWLSMQKECSHKSIKQLRDANKALYMRLYRRDREWLKANSPKSLKRASSVRIDWNKRDEEILAEVTKVVEELLNPENKPVRVTVGKVGYLIGERALLEKKLDKLPLTKSFLHQKVEAIEKFQHRRIYYAIKRSRAIGEVLVSWKILRGAGIKETNKWTEIVNRILADL
ncbi:TnsD family Tn7-like transposition protein [Cytobacillus gottheilii]|uniref:TnsD family Tn7-like transposition protein n=1 Tax=Cytobacillus gottheilii TaxID=859144 RepID=UPI00083351CD|nr:TnsD family Tn7-like transposition protein [Cytobacillus gottheilii]